MYMAIRSQMSSIMELIRPELSELSALELENLPHFILIRSQMNFIMDLIGPEMSELSAFEFENLTYLTLFTL